MNKPIKLPHFVVREVRRAVLSAKLALHLCRCAVDCGDLDSARQYRIEAREKLVRARFFVGMANDRLAVYGHDRVEEVFDFFFCDFNFSVFPKLPADKPVEVVQDDSPAEQVFASTASSRLSVCRLWHFLFFAATKQFHPKLWCPLITQHQARKGLPSGWPPLPGKRSLVGGEGQVRVSSGQASS